MSTPTAKDRERARAIVDALVIPPQTQHALTSLIATALAEERERAAKAADAHAREATNIEKVRSRQIAAAIRVGDSG